MGDFIISFFLAVATIFCAGFIISFAVGIMQKVGLIKVADVAMQMVLYDREAQARQFTILNHLWFRFGLLFLVFSIISYLVGRFFSTAGLVAYIYWIWKNKLPNGNVQTSDTTQMAPQYSTNTELEISQIIFKTTEGDLIIDDCFRGVLAAGDPGAGKTSRLVVPTIRQVGKKQFTGVIYDVKFPELASEVNASYRNSNVKQYYVCFTDLSRSHQINPFEAIVDSTMARDAASTIIKNLDKEAAKKRDVWIIASEVLLTGVIWYLKENQPQFCTLPHAISLLLESPPDKLISLLEQDEEVKGLISGIKDSMKSEKTFASILVTLKNNLTTLNTPEIFWVLGGKSEVPSDLNDPANPCILTVGNARHTEVYSPIVSLIIFICINRMNRNDRQQSIVLIDESPTINIPNIDKLPATGRSAKIFTFLTIQDLSQQDGKLGPYEARSIRGTLSTQFYGHTPDVDTARKVTELFGKEDVQYESYSESSSNQIFGPGSTSISTSTQQRDRIPVNQLSNFSQGEFAGVIAEGNVTKFRRVLLPGERLKEVLPPFKTVTREETKARFREIKAEVRSILSKLESTNDQESKSWEDFS